MNLSEAGDRLRTKLKELTLFDKPIKDSDELFYDLCLSGVDFLDFLSWVGFEYGVDFSTMDVGQFAPHEGAEVFRPLLRAIGFRPYRSIRLRDVLDAVERKAWCDP